MDNFNISNFNINNLNIADNLVRFRHGKKITQAQLAEFIGVTKASVSKWETGQSTPDIMLLPQLAAFFDVSVDELLGYQPQLSKEQIQKLYQEFTADFANRPFDEVMAKTQAYVKKYYSCYPFLSQICGLWLNHYMLHGKPEKHPEILHSISELCEHIKKNCKDVRICNDIIALQSIVFLQLGQAQEIIDTLEDTLNPNKLIDQCGSVLIQAYRMSGNTDKADSFAQICMYKDLLSLVRNAVSYLSIHMQDLPVCEETIVRIEKVMEAYAFPKLHPNNAGAFEYQAAMCYAIHNEKQKALEHADRYVSCLQELFASYDILLHGDSYFNRIAEWFVELDNGPNPPRNRQLALQDIGQSFDNPAFNILEGNPEFEKLKNKMKKIK